MPNLAQAEISYPRGLLVEETRIRHNQILPLRVVTAGREIEVGLSSHTFLESRFIVFATKSCQRFDSGTSKSTHNYIQISIDSKIARDLF